MLMQSGCRHLGQSSFYQGQSIQLSRFKLTEDGDRSPFQQLSFNRRSQFQCSSSSSLSPLVSLTRSPKRFDVDVGVTDTANSVNIVEGDRRWDEYVLTGLRSGQQVHVQLNSDVFDPYLQLVNAGTGEIIATNDDGVDHNSRLTFNVKPGVNYKLQISSYSSHVLGPYDLKTETFVPKKMKSFNFDYGHGLIDVAAAIAEMEGESWFNIKRGRHQRFSEKVSSKKWSQNILKVPQLWKQGLIGKKVTVAVVDTGVDISHPELKGNLWQNPHDIPNNGKDDDGNGFVDDVNGWNFADHNADVFDIRDHGTHVAGIIAANKRGNMKGLAYGAKIMPIKVMGESKGSQNQVAQGIRYAVENGAEVINISLGANPGSAMDSRLKRAIRFAYRKGAMVVVASGNERQMLGATQPGEPAGYVAQHALGLVVGAIDLTNTVASFSNPTGNRRSPFVVAPGTSIFSLSSQDPSGYKWRQGTSMAAAHVSGMVALMLSVNPDLKPRDLITLISNTANHKDINET